jgi:hypothetical protein
MPHQLVLPEGYLATPGSVTLRQMQQLIIEWERLTKDGASPPSSIKIDDAEFTYHRTT